MSVDQIAEEVKAIIRDKLKLEEVSEDSDFTRDLGADSLDIVELVMEFEARLHCDIPDEDARKLRTVGDVINYVKLKTNKQ